MRILNSKYLYETDKKKSLKHHHDKLNNYLIFVERGT